MAPAEVHKCPVPELCSAELSEAPTKQNALPQSFLWPWEGKTLRAL